MQTLTKDQIRIEELIKSCDTYFGLLADLGEKLVVYTKNNPEDQIL